MPVTRATVRLHKETQVPLDDVVNVWHFAHTATLDSTMADLIGDSIEYFYTGIFDLYSGCMDRDTPSAGLIELATVSMGSAGPDDDVVTGVQFSKAIPESSDFSAPAAATNYPSEVAIVLSFAGDLTGIPEETGMTRPAARRRGRLFLGPFNTSVNTTAGGFEPTVSAAARDTILDRYEATIAILDAASPAIVHCIYSPTSAQAFTILSAWIDVAFDTMRSRGVADSSRTVRTITQGVVTP